MGRRPVPVHYLRENAAERTPRRLVVLDTESEQVSDGEHVYHTLRLWSVALVTRGGKKDTTDEYPVVSGTDRGQLARLVTEHCRVSATTWVYGHNLAFDLPVSGLLEELRRLGWELTVHALASEQPWARLAKGNYHLVIADSWSLFRTSVEQLGADVGIGKPPLPLGSEDLADWRRRCEADVRITTAAVLEAMTWWDDNRMGNWTLTGPGLGWNAMRHVHPPRAVVIDPDPEARRLERDAIMGGYRRQWVHGCLVRHPVADVDLVHAHLSVVANYPLPRRRMARFESLRVDSSRLCSGRVGTLARCLVHCATPRYPCRIAEEVWYPTGRFWTTLAGPELLAARDRGELEEIGPGYHYLLDRHMLGWGRWMTGLLDDPQQAPPPAVYRMVKAWSRSVIGRWALRTSERIDRYDTPLEGIQVSLGRRHPGGQRTATIQAGGHVDILDLDVEGDNSFPAVLAWVQAWTRLHLLALLGAYPDCWLAANTDGAILDLEAVRERDSRRWGPDLGEGQPYGSIAETIPADVAGAVCPLTVRVKRQSPWAKVLSPQHVVLEDERRLSGIPRSAVEVDPGVYEFHTWPGYRAQVEPGAPEGYTQGSRRVSLNAIAPQGWLWNNGTVTPPEIASPSEDTQQLNPPAVPGDDGPYLAPPEHQHRRLRELLVHWAPDVPQLYADPHR